MEPKQIVHVNRNLTKLLEHTTVNVLLLSELQKLGMLKDVDVQLVKAKETPFQQADELYRIMKTKVNGFINLISALREANQSGAYNLLLNVSTEMIKNLPVGITQTVRDLLNGDQIEEIRTWVNKTLSLDERQELYETFFNDREQMSLWRDTIPAAYSLYIPRFLSRRITVKPTLLEEKCEDVFVFKNITRQQLRDLLPDMRTVSIESSGSQSLRKKLTTRFILLDVETDWNRISTKLQNTSAHLLRYEDTSRTFILDKTTSVTSILRKHLMDAREAGINPEYCSEDQFLEKFQSENVKGVCICDLPGMGKTFLLTNLARKARQKYPDRIVSFIQLRNLELPKLPLVNDEVVSMFLCYVSTSQLATCILRKLIEQNKIKIEIFFDGLDEVEERKLQRTLHFIQAICKCMPGSRLYVTSRQVVRTELENTLGIIAYDIVAFDEETQMQYLMSCWLANDASCVKSRLHEYGKVCLQKFKNNLKQGERNITGIPLQCKLIAEVSMEQAIAFADKKRKNQPHLPETFAGSLTEIYSKYMLRQLGEATCTLDCIKNNFGFSSKQCGDSACQVKRYHVWKSIQLIFPILSMELPIRSERFFENLSKQKILSPGLLEEKHNDTGSSSDLEFVHRTFAEYLVAEYFFTVIFTKLYPQEQQNTFQQLAFDQLFTPGEYKYMGFSVYAMRLREQVFAYFLDTMLSENHNQNILITCKANLSSFFQFANTLEGCMHVDSDGLLHVYIQAVENWLNEDIATRVVKRNFYTASKGELIRLENVLRIVATALSVEAAKSVQKFFIKRLHIDLMSVYENPTVHSPIVLAIRRGDYMLTEYLAQKQPLRETIFCCVVNTYFEMDELVEKKLDIARMLIDKCPALITNHRNFVNRGSLILADGIHLKAFKFLIENGADIRATRADGKNMIFLAAVYMSDENFIELCDYLSGQHYENNNTLLYLLQPELLNKMFVDDSPWEYKEMTLTRTLLKILLYLKAKSCTNLVAHPPQVTRWDRFLAEEDQTLGELLKTFLDAEFYKNHTEILSILFHSAIYEGMTTVAAQLLIYDTLLVRMPVEFDHEPVPVLFSVYDAETLKFLVERGASIFEVDKTFGRTVLHFLAEKGKLEAFVDVVKYLCTLFETMPRATDNLSASDSTASVLKPQNLNELFNWPTIHFQQTPLHYFSMYLSPYFSIKEHEEVLDVLLFGGSNIEADRMATINAVDKDGNSALLLSLCRTVPPSEDFVARLVHNGAELKIRNKMGCNAVHKCAQNYNLLKHLIYFIKLGVDCNDIDSNGNNALQCGLLNCNYNWHKKDKYGVGHVVEFLLDAKVDKKHVNHQSKTAYDIAKEASFPLGILKMLKVK